MRTARRPRARRWLALAVVAVLAACAPPASEVFLDDGGAIFHREFLVHPRAPERRIELVWTAPTGVGPWPGILMIHGHQPYERNGAETYVRSDRLRHLARLGFVAAALSQPGYGRSSGPPDFSGPLSQDAALAALDFLRRQPSVRADRIVLYGFSRGAMVAAMAAARDPRIAAAVLVGGVYDLGRAYPTGLEAIDESIRIEAGTTAEAFAQRSALVHAHRIRAPVLLLHGGADDRAPPDQAEAFLAALRAHGVAAEARIFPGLPHALPISLQLREIDAFLGQHLGAPWARPTQERRALSPPRLN